MYKDRGIIKWAPFDSLVGFRGVINEVIFNQHKMQKPILSEDNLEELNQIFAKALKEKSEIEITYYENGYLKTENTKIARYDALHQCVKFEDGLKLKLADIIYINMLI